MDSLEEKLLQQQRIAHEQTGYAIALQRAIEYHCDGKEVPKIVADECPWHAAKLNEYHATLTGAKVEA